MATKVLNHKSQSLRTDQIGVCHSFYSCQLKAFFQPLRIAPPFSHCSALLSITMSDSRRLQTYVAYREHLRWLLDFAGLWPSEDSSRAYRLLPYLQIIVGCGAALKIGNFIAHNITHIRIVTRAMSIMTSIILNMFRVCTTFSEYFWFKSVIEFFQVGWNCPDQSKSLT